MLRQQKRAWYELTVSALAIVAVVVLGFTIRMPQALAGLGILGFYGLTPLLFRRRPAPGEVVVDERDRHIAMRAATAGFAASYVAFVLSGVGLWAYAFLCRGVEEVSVHQLVTPVWLAFLVFCVVRAATMLALYGGEVADASE